MSAIEQLTAHPARIALLVGAFLVAWLSVSLTGASDEIRKGAAQTEWLEFAVTAMDAEVREFDGSNNDPVGRADQALAAEAAYRQSVASMQGEFAATQRSTDELDQLSAAIDAYLQDKLTLYQEVNAIHKTGGDPETDTSIGSRVRELRTDRNTIRAMLVAVDEPEILATFDEYSKSLPELDEELA